MSKVDAHLSEGFRSSHDFRERHFKLALDVLLGEHELPHFIRAFCTAEHFDGTEDIGKIRDAFAAFYVDSAVQFLGDENVGYSKHAYDVLQYLFENAAETKIVKALLKDKKNPLAYFIRKDGKLRDLEEIPKKKRRRAQLVEALHRAQFATYKDAGKVTAVGCLLGILIGYAQHGIDATYADLLQPGALGATGVLAAMKSYLGFTSPEAKQAGETGLSRRGTKSKIKVGTGEILKLLGTYAFFGGVLPLIGIVNSYEGPRALGKYSAFTGPDMLISINDGHWGNFRGPGAFIASHIDAVVTHSDNAAGLMIDNGLRSGLALFWNGFSVDTVLGSSLEQGYLTWRDTVRWFRCASGIPGSSSPRSGPGAPCSWTGGPWRWCVPIPARA